MSGIAIAEYYGAKIGSIYYILKKNNIPTRKNGSNFQKYKANYDFFEKIDNQKKAYWLGFIAADGFVSSRDNLFGIALAKKDREHLEKFKNDIEAEQPVLDYISDTLYMKNTHYSRITITSKKTKEDLISHGILENKTFLLEFPEISPELINHYIRGYFDGDGSLTRYKSKSGLKWEYQFKITGTKEFLSQIQFYIGFKDKKLHKRYNDDKNTYYISIGGNKQVEKIMDFLYQNSKVSLKRKEIRYLELKSQSSKVVIP